MIEDVGSGITVIGTAHVSAKSVQTVEETIRARRPARVLVELDQRRLEAIQDPDRWSKTDIVEVIKQKKQHLFLLQLYLANMQARMGKELGVKPGSEMLRAIDVAHEVGAEVVLIDRDISTTLKRGFGAMGFWQRVSLGLNFLMEMMPRMPHETERPPAKRQVATSAATYLAVVLLLLSPLASRLAGGTGNILDAAVGFSSAPLVSVGLIGVLVGILLVIAVPLGSTASDATWWQRLRSAPVAGALLGLLAWWAWRFSGGLSGAFFDALLPGPGGGRLFAGIVAAVLLGTTIWLGALAAVGMRRFGQNRAAVERQELDIEAMLETDAISAMTDEFAKFAPVVKHALIDERDAYMASHIADQATHGPVVAVVGAGHMPGIRRHLAAGTQTIDRADLDLLPRRRITAGKVIAYTLPAIILALFAYGAYAGGWEVLSENLRIWILVNGTLSALGAALALGHPLSWVVAFLAAPITSLNPLLAAGWFAGLAEAKLRTPKVADFEAIQQISKFKDFWTNPVVRVLLVTALANLGSAIGTYIAGVEIVRNVVGA